MDKPQRRHGPPGWGTWFDRALAVIVLLVLASLIQAMFGGETNRGLGGPLDTGDGSSFSSAVEGGRGAS